MNNPWNIIGWFLVVCIFIGGLVAITLGINYIGDYNSQFINTSTPPSLPPGQALIASCLIVLPSAIIFFMASRLHEDLQKGLMVVGAAVMAGMAWWTLTPEFTIWVESII